MAIMGQFTVNGVTDVDMKQAAFFNFSGRETFDKAWAILAPEQITEMAFDTIMGHLRDYFSLQPSKITCHHAFYTRAQAPGDYLTGFATALRQVAYYCNFMELKNMLHDQLKCGLQDQKLQKWLFTKKKLTFKEVLVKTLAAEIVDQSTQEVHHS